MNVELSQLRAFDFCFQSDTPLSAPCVKLQVDRLVSAQLLLRANDQWASSPEIPNSTSSALRVASKPHQRTFGAA